MLLAGCVLAAAVAVGLHRAGPIGAAGPSAAGPGVVDPAVVLPADADPPPSFVTRSGRTLLLDGEPFRFTGFNLYNAAASDLYSCPSGVRLGDAGLDAAMRQVREAGGTVVRFWAFQSYTRGGTDYTGVDRVLAAARTHGLKVLPVLENQWSDCSRPVVGPLSAVQNGTWFSAGYRARLPGQPLSFRDYVETITSHYRDDPTILGWSLMNEAETAPADPADPVGESELVRFARDLAAIVHAADPHHLLTLGTQSNGAPGSSGADFSAVYGLPGLDFAEVHDWAIRGADDEAMPGAPDGSDGSELPDPDQCQATTAPIACSFALARELGKPLVVGEAGIEATDDASRAIRSEQVAAKLDAAFRAGASGYLVWQLNSTNTDGYAAMIGSTDPLYDVLREAGRRWSSG